MISLFIVSELIEISSAFLLSYAQVQASWKLL